MRSIAELSLEPTESRGWGSFYQALNHGTLDESMALDLLLGHGRRSRASSWLAERGSDEG